MDIVYGVFFVLFVFFVFFSSRIHKFTDATNRHR